MQITDYIKPELLAVALVLYFVGIGLKHSQTIQNQYVPGVLGILGILLAGLYVFATTEFQTRQAGNPCGGTEHVCRSAAGAETQVL